MLQRHTEIYSDIVTTLAARFRQTDEDMAASSFQTVIPRRPRAAAVPTISAKTLGRDRADRHRITQSDLAAMAGVARESVSRTASGSARRSSRDRPAPASSSTRPGSRMRRRNNGRPPPFTAG